MAKARRISFDDDDGSEAREPVGGLAHGQSIMDAVEVRVALAPEQFCGVESRNNEEEEQGAALDRLDHEVGDGPDVRFQRRGRRNSRC